MPIFSLAWKSLLNRRSTAALTAMSIALSVTLLLGVERLRNETRASFANTISQTDLIVGARSSSLREHNAGKFQPLKTLSAKYARVLTAIHSGR